MGITQAGWDWLVSVVGADEQGMTNMLSEHNRQAPRERISSKGTDSGAAELMAWLLACRERTKGVSTRVTLVPSALAQALNERDNARFGRPAPRARQPT